MFEIRDRAACGRTGRFTTPHGTVDTPTLLPVINPNLSSLAPKRMRELFGVQMVITNAYILGKTPELRERVLDKGVHEVLDWDGPVMTDSGTFQAYVYGDVEVKPDEVVDFQKRIGSDVGTILDVFTVPETSRAQAASELDETERRAKTAAARRDGMMLAATVQGGRFPDLREDAARRMAALDADVHPIGGVVPLMESGEYARLARIILAAKRGLPAGRPVHLFGAGHPLVFPLAVALGCDLFDSASYAKYAKADRMIFPWGTRRLEELDELPCACLACSAYASATELKKAPAEERVDALTKHNLAVSFAELRRIRVAVRDGTLWDLVEERATQNPALQDAMVEIAKPENAADLERHEPTSARRALSYRGPFTMHRPAVRRLHSRILERWRPTSRRCVLLPHGRRPYARTFAPWFASFADADPIVETPLGPIPLELDGVWPVSQNVFPDHPDPATVAVREGFAKSFWARFPFEETERFSRSGHSASTNVEARDAFDRRRLVAVARHQFGRTAGQALMHGNLAFRRSGPSRSVRNVSADDAHVASVRAADGLLSLTAAGGRRLHGATKAPAHRVVMQEEAAQHISSGKNPLAAGVASSDPALRAGDQCLLVDPEDELLAGGRMRVAGWEVSQIGRGAVARTRWKVADA